MREAQEAPFGQVRGATAAMRAKSYAPIPNGWGPFHNYIYVRST